LGLLRSEAGHPHLVVVPPSLTEYQLGEKDAFHTRAAVRPVIAALSYLSVFLVDVLNCCEYRVKYLKVFYPKGKFFYYLEFACGK